MAKRLHPGFPIVEGRCQISRDWSLELPEKFNRRIEDEDLVLWRPGLTLWIAAWGNDGNATVEERLNDVLATASSDRFDEFVEQAAKTTCLTYRLDENQEGRGLVSAMYAFVFAEAGELDVAAYADSASDIEIAERVIRSVRQQE